MKKIYTYVSLLFVLLSSCSATRNYPQQNYYSDDQSAQPEITYQQFYDGLSPYGNWVNYGSYGYAWTPNDQGFRPYSSNGHWVYTSYGWTWASDYNWGWAPFHYGRWVYDNGYGWMWLPGYEWAPAWVSWRAGGDYYGWAPLGPGMNGEGYYGSQIPNNYWTFVPGQYITSPRINNYYVNNQQSVTMINNTTVINNTNVTTNKTVYVTGPSVTDVERVTHQKIGPVKIVQSNTPGRPEVNGSTLKMYRPVIKQSAQQQSQQTYRPAKVINLGEQNEPNPQKVTNGNAPARTTTPPQNESHFPVLHNENVPQQNQPQQSQQQPARTFPEKNNQINNSSNNAGQNQGNENINRNEKEQPANNTTAPAVQKPQFFQNNNNKNNQPVNKPVAPVQNNNQQQPAPRITNQQRTNNNVNQQNQIHYQQQNKRANNRMMQPQQRFNQPNGNMQNNTMRQPGTKSDNNTEQQRQDNTRSKQ